ncbi:MAG: hypothetical protein JWQ09_3460 [Segetibacter sp.]|nr:hypothetical protein [Segetibacter sp.]
MPFTLEQLTEHFELGQNDLSSWNTYFKSHPNYMVVIDYLTGNNHSLQGLLSTNENYALRDLLSLLKDIEMQTQNDTLILNVITHPDAYPFTQNYLDQWLISYAANKNTASAIAAVSTIFNNLGITNNEVFYRFIHFLKHTQDDYKLLLAPNSEIKRYLISIIPQQVIYKNPYSIVYWGSEWNFFYFLLLDEGKPDPAKEYVRHGFFEIRQDITSYIINYNEGKYVPFILDWLSIESINLVELAAKLATAIYLYETDKERYVEIAIELSGKYLRQFESNNSKDKWERQVLMQFAAEQRPTSIGLSAAAFHFLLKGNKSSTKELVFDWFKKKVIVSFDLLKVLFNQLKQEALPFLKLGLKADTSVGGLEYFNNIIYLLTTEFKANEYVDVLWDITSSKSKPIKEQVSKLLAEKDPDAEPKAIKLLQSKNAEARQSAALILSFFNSSNSLNAVKAILNTEANDNARDIFLQIAAASLPPKADKQFIKAMVQAAANRNKLNKPIETWLNEIDLPALFYKDGEQLNQQEVRFLFYRMSRVKAMRSDIEAKYLIELLDRERSGPFAKHIIQLFIDKEAKPDYKYLMALAAMLGGDETVDKLRTVINGWIEIYRTKMVEYGIGALALQGSNKALRLVEYYSRKYKNKTASVGASALQALEDAAEELGISSHELGDRIVPDFGFEGLFKHFTINGEEYRAFIDSNFKLAFFDEENKKLKALPSTATKELKEEFKNILKEVREVVKSQSLRLEHYLVTQRRWSSEEWQNFYLTNPVMFIYATKLLWGKYDKEGNLLECFLCLDDTSLISFEDDEIELDEDLLIGIVHPIQLDSESLQNWKKKLFNLSVETIFPQLDRKIAVLKDEDKNKKISYQFDGIETAEGAIKSTLEKHGWRKGQTGDGGYLDHFIFENRTNRINAVLEVEGVFVGGYGSDADPKLGRLFFIDKKKETTKWFMLPKDDKDERLICLGMVDKTFYSEVVGSVSLIKPKE